MVVWGLCIGGTDARARGRRLFGSDGSKAGQESEVPRWMLKSAVDGDTSVSIGS